MKLKIFISWSGKLSHQIALVFRDWLPNVIQNADPYVSSEDIDKGKRWAHDIASELQDSYYGIICVTRDNLEAPWVNFEAGALSKSIKSSNVSPFLFLVDIDDVEGPLQQFQLTVFSKADVGKLIISINKQLERPYCLKSERLKKIFDQWWPVFESKLNDIIKNSPLAYHGIKLNRREIEQSTILLQHRSTHGHLLKKAISEKNDVFLLSIMPQNLVRTIEGMVNSGEFNAKSFRLLIMEKNIAPELADSISLHLNESNDKVTQINESWTHWEKLKDKCPQLQIRGYESVPMYQITMVNKDWMTIEMIPFAVGTLNRPALFVTSEDNPQLFEQFRTSVEHLWKNAGKKKG